eukprot:TRINITY_DN727_c2_g1_i9.p4 TRINITY_DN727_c2_g1~~TRINITY_DN727_c2_g1_i9.p4  ORF type:complete len:142 (+),score=10.05 TRINITY_DN727_c2_g1_i9:298-723(+)
MANTAPIESTQWKWATTQYVSWRAMSKPELARTTPVRPPMVNRKMNPKAKRQQPLGLLIVKTPKIHVAQDLVSMMTQKFEQMLYCEFDAIKPRLKHIHELLPPHIYAIQETTFIPVGTAMINVAAVKQALVSTSRPTVKRW